VLFFCVGAVLNTTGTLDPVRNLTGLTYLVLYSNSIGGMSVRTAVGMVVVVLAFGCQRGWGITAAHTRDVALEHRIAWWCFV
jgi:hypothetical protein